MSFSPFLVTNDFIRSTSPRGIFLVYLSVTFLFPMLNTVDDILIFSYNKMQRSTILVALAIGVALFLLYKNTSSTGKWTVYGTMGCGWTRKQLEYMKKNGKAHTFVDCDKEGCNDMKAFPTLKHPNGEVTVGYKE